MHLAELPRLSQLTLDSTGVDDEGFVAVKGLKKLHHLTLVNTKVTPAGLSILNGHPTLRYLTVPRNSALADVEELRKKLPRIVIMQ